MNPPDPRNVVVSCTLTIDGREYTAQQAYSPSSWRLMKDDPLYKQAIEIDIRHALGQLVIRELAPPVTVHTPAEAQQQRAEPSASENPCDIGRGLTLGRRCAAYPECTCGN
jgi:hypothetical protein